MEAEIEIVPEPARPYRNPAPRVRPFDPRDVKLAPEGDFWEAQNRSFSYLLSVNDDQMLYNFRKAAGLDTRGAPAMIGWDAPDGLLRGHTTGHYLSALSLCYEALGNRKIREKAEYMIKSLAECQEAFSHKEGFHPGFLSGYSEKQFDLLEQYARYPRIWAPYYTMHKILSGLLDCSRAFHSASALKIARGMGDWVYRRLSRLPHEKRTAMWGLYIAGEFGGMNDAMARLYLITGEKRYLETARLFDNDRLFYPLRQRVDALNGLHANQHIPQVIGAMRIFEATGEKEYYDMACFFWHAVVRDHIYTIGGTGESEMFHRPGAAASLLTEHTAESCATYNMLKLTAELYSHDPDVRYMDYYERAMVNHILSSGDKRPTGLSTYFMPMKPGSRKLFENENSCCHGTGLENHFKYAENIYYKDAGRLFVNLFLDSEAVWEEKSVSLSQKNRESGGKWETEIRFSGQGNFELLVRIPSWCEGKPFVMVNGREEKAGKKRGYLSLKRRWKTGDRVKVVFGCGLRLERAPDDSGKASVCFGPYVLAALTDSKDFLRLDIKKGPLSELLKREEGGIRFLLRGQNTEFIPLCRVDRQAFQVYVQV